MKYILLFLFACFTLTALAAPDSYQVELIIFSQLSSSALDSEQWPLVTPILNSSKADKISLITKDKMQLRAQAKDIINNPNYQMLLHLAWQASAKQLNQGQMVHIYGGEAFDAAGKQIADVALHQQVPFNQYPIWEINGLVNVKLSRYFNFNFNLYFAEPFSELSQLSQNAYFANKNTGVFYFHLLQQRRTRSGELNYIDYPIYGVLVEVFPISNAAAQ